MPSTVIFCPDVESEPTEADVFEPVGAVQPFGTSTVTVPFERPPVAAVYVNVNVRPDCLASALVGETAIVPAPSAELFSVTVGAVIPPGVPPAVDFSVVLNVFVPRAVPVVTVPADP